MEVWKPVPGYEGLYEVSDLGRVRVLPRQDAAGRNWGPKVLKQTLNKGTGYMAVGLRKDGVQVYAVVHPLVLKAFVSGRPDGFAACHNDGDRLNNRLDNLRWDSYTANTADSIKHGTFHHNHRHPDGFYDRVRDLTTAGYSAPQIASWLGAAVSTVTYLRSQHAAGA